MKYYRFQTVRIKLSAVQDINLNRQKFKRMPKSLKKLHMFTWNTTQFLQEPLLCSRYRSPSLRLPFSLRKDCSGSSVWAFHALDYFSLLPGYSESCKL